MFENILYLVSIEKIKAPSIDPETYKERRLYKALVLTVTQTSYIYLDNICNLLVKILKLFETKIKKKMNM